MPVLQAAYVATTATPMTIPPTSNNALIDYAAQIVLPQSLHDKLKIQNFEQNPYIEAILPPLETANPLAKHLPKLTTLVPIPIAASIHGMPNIPKPKPQMSMKQCRLMRYKSNASRALVSPKKQPRAKNKCLRQEFWL